MRTYLFINRRNSDALSDTARWHSISRPDGASVAVRHRWQMRLINAVAWAQAQALLMRRRSRRGASRPLIVRVLSLLRPLLIINFPCFCARNLLLAFAYRDQLILCL